MDCNDGQTPLRNRKAGCLGCQTACIQCEMPSIGCQMACNDCEVASIEGTIRSFRLPGVLARLHCPPRLACLLWRALSALVGGLHRFVPRPQKSWRFFRQADKTIINSENALFKGIIERVSSHQIHHENDFDLTFREPCPLPTPSSVTPPPAA